jgi:serine/threonine-protein kinase RsbW
MHVTVALTLPADERLLPCTRRLIAGYLEHLGAAAEVVGDVVLALDEAMSNVVRHAFPAGKGSYQVRADLRPHEVVIEVTDDGVGFDPMRSVGSGRLRLGGRGIQLIRRLMTVVEVESPTRQGGTRLTMRRRIPASAYSAGPDHDNGHRR